MKKQKTTLAGAYDLTLTLHWRGTKNEERACQNLQYAMKELGKDTDVDKVGMREVTGLINGWKTAGVSNGTVNRRLSALGRVLSTAYKAGLRVTPPPAGLRLREAQHRTRILSEDEVHRMVDMMPGLSGLLVAFLVDTGLRVSEALHLRWRNASILDQSVTVESSKNGQPRTVPLTLRAMNTLNNLRMLSPSVAGNDARIFGSLSQRTFNWHWTNARKACGISSSDVEFVPHALRHTCATNLVLAGVPLAVVQKWMGHKSIVMTMRYAHVGDDSLKEAAARLNAGREEGV